MLKHIKIFMGISIIVFIIVTFITKEVGNSISSAISFTFLLFLCYEKLLWRFNPFEKTPKFYKQYISKQISSYNGRTEFSSEVTIKQTLSTLKITEKWNNNACSSVTAVIKQDENDIWKLYYTYLTHPDPFHAVDSGDEMHFGTCMLNIESNKNITGEYFTNRRPQPTIGTIIWEPVKTRTPIK